MTYVFYDTKCNFCASIIVCLQKKSGDKKIKLFDSEEFRRDRFAHFSSENLNSVDSFLLVDKMGVHAYSDAVIQLLISLGGIHKFMGRILKIVPKKIRDGIYRVIARNRYRIFGKARCQLSCKEKK
jgi:predicted DCC family thiol-disulfide oxidoreductase YuxK